MKIIIRFRIWLAAKIDPWPDGGEGWCVDCVLNEGRMLIVPAAGVERHLDRHREKHPGERIKLRWRS